MQAKCEDKLTSSLQDEESQLSQLASKLKPLGNTIVSPSCLKSAADKENFSALLQSISPFMKHGQGVWWYKEAGLVVFHDGADEPAFRQEGPNLFHLRSSTLQDVQKQCIADWTLIKETGVELLVSDRHQRMATVSS